jgi:ubiquinone biosynthesis O-methyltransferase
MELPPPPRERQAAYWDSWDEQRYHRLNPAQERQASHVLRWLAGLGRFDLRILDVGCGSGWLCGKMRAFGTVHGVDITPNTITFARERHADVRFDCGTFESFAAPSAAWDVITSLEVLPHVRDQQEFIGKCARLLAPGGTLILSVQNRHIYSRMDTVAPPSPDQIRKWLSPRELRRLVRDHFAVVEHTSLSPEGSRGFLRIVNAPKLDRTLGAVFTPTRVTRWKESLMLGRTQMMLAVKRPQAAASARGS